MTLVRRGAAAAKHKARVAFLLARPELYAGAPGINDDVTDFGRGVLDQLVATMLAHDAGLFGRTPGHIKRETVRRIVSELRGESVGVGFQLPSQL